MVLAKKAVARWLFLVAFLSISSLLATEDLLSKSVRGCCGGRGVRAAFPVVCDVSDRLYRLICPFSASKGHTF